MAIHADFPDLKAEVIVDGEVLKEYDYDGQSQPLTTTKYVEVVSEAHFGVRYTLPMGLKGSIGVKASLKIDGTFMRCYSHKNNRMEKRAVTQSIDTAHSSIDGSSYSRKFRFSQLRIGT